MKRVTCFSYVPGALPRKAARALFPLYMTQLAGAAAGAAFTALVPALTSHRSW